MKRRLTWSDVIPFPGNPIYPRRLDQMRREWGGYHHDLIGSPSIFDNSAEAFPDFPPDTLFIGEGNHRYELAKQDDALSKEFLADLHRGLSYTEMHRLRRGLNNRRTVKPAEIFLHRAEENALGREHRIREMVEGVGWSVTYKPENRGLTCTHEMTWVWERDHGALVRAIQTYEAAFGTNAVNKGQAQVIKGLGAFWVKYPEADADRLVASLKGVKVHDLYESGRSQQRSATFIKTVFDGVRYSLAMGYNRQRRAGKKLAV